MLAGIFYIIFFFILNQPLLKYLKKQHKSLDIKLFNGLYAYHIFFLIVYYIYAQFNNSDSYHYFYYTRDFEMGWFQLLNSGTDFIRWAIYPFIHYLGFNYEASMVFFAWTGYVGFVYFFIFFRENLHVRPRFQGYDLITILLFLPNMHFWTSSLGKGSLIFCGIALVTYGLSLPSRRIFTMVLGAFLVYMIRPHILFAILIGMGVGFVLGREKVPLYQKYLVVLAGLGVSILVFDNVLLTLGVDPNTEDVYGSVMDQAGFNSMRLRHSAGSGVDMASYPLPYKLFTFWFRPLFFDAPGVMGLFVSVENLLYLLLFIKLFDRQFITYIIQAPPLVKMSGVVFISISISMTFFMSNLGIIIRQKSMIMYFLFFVIIAFMDWKKVQKIKRRQAKFRRWMARRNAKLEGV